MVTAYCLRDNDGEFIRIFYIINGDFPDDKLKMNLKNMYIRIYNLYL